MLTIRLQRVGKKRQPIFRIVLAEKQRAVKKKFIELLGTYNPQNKDFSIKDEERVKYWIGQNVELSPTINNLFIEKGLLDGEKVKAWRPKVKAKDEEGKTEGKADDKSEKPAETSDSEESTETEKAEEAEAADSDSAGDEAGAGKDKKEQGAASADQPAEDSNNDSDKAEAKTEEKQDAKPESAPEEESKEQTNDKPEQDAPSENSTEEQTSEKKSD